jgi:hypothetical protein
MWPPSETSFLSSYALKKERKKKYVTAEREKPLSSTTAVSSFDERLIDF